MLKHRLIPCLILKDDRIVQSVLFKRYLPIGSAKIAIEFFVNWDVDEIILLDIHATRKGLKPRLDLISFYAKKCFVPFTVGGGISTLEDIRNVIKAGADKVSLNTVAIKNPALIAQSAEQFGCQCVTVSIDAKRNNNGKYEVYINSGTEPTGVQPSELAQKVESLGAGEILINSIDRDGTKKGYDVDLIRQVSDTVKIPVIACGGVGKMEHFVDGIRTGGAQAVAAANIFQYTEHSTIIAKAYMQKTGIDVRLCSSVNYDGFQINELGRIV